MNLNSIQTWLYENSTNYNGNDQNPAHGSPRVFFDDVHAFITGAAVAPGSTIRLQKDSTNAAAFYYIDVVDLEAPPPPLAQPANSLSTASFGAVADDTNLNNSTAIQNCINAAQSLGKSVWMASASVSDSAGPPNNAIDGNINTRWATGTPQVNGQWFHVDMGSTNTIYKIVLDAGSSSSDYPRGYQVNLSNDGVTWGNLVAAGAGSSAVTTITFPTNTARYVRVTQTGSVGGLWWSIHEFNVFGRNGTVPTTSPQLSFGINNGRLQFGWPADHVGWRLEAQTNWVDSGLGTNWVTVPGSTATNQIWIQIDPANGSAFFRLVYP